MPATTTVGPRQTLEAVVDLLTARHGLTEHRRAEGLLVELAAPDTGGIFRITTGDRGVAVEAFSIGAQWRKIHGIRIEPGPLGIIGETASGYVRACLGWTPWR